MPTFQPRRMSTPSRPLPHGHDPLTAYIGLAQFRVRYSRIAMHKFRRDEDMKVEALGGLLSDVVGRIEARAAQSAVRLQKAHDRVMTGADRMDGVAETLEGAAQKLEDQVNRLTNGGPPLEGSSTPPAPSSGVPHE